MNRKRIRDRLSRVFNTWVESIKDEKVRDKVKENSFITGGAIVSLLLNEEPKDYDVYFRDKDTVLSVARYYVDQFNKENGEHKNVLGYSHKAFVLDGAGDIKEQIDDAGESQWYSRMIYNLTPERVKVIVRSDGIASAVSLEETETALDEADNLLAEPPVEKKKKGDKDKKEPFRPIFLSTNAITLSDKIQLVIRFYGEPSDVHETYDYAHCCNYWESRDNGLTLLPEALESILGKNLIYRGSRYPLCSIIRLRKFLKKGWNINAGQILKMCFQLSQLDLSNPDVLEDQLIGVDTMYFKQFVNEVRESQKGGSVPFVVDNNYVCTVVDKIFG